MSIEKLGEKFRKTPNFPKVFIKSSSIFLSFPNSFPKVPLRNLQKYESALEQSAKNSKSILQYFRLFYNNLQVWSVRHSFMNFFCRKTIKIQTSFTKNKVTSRKMSKVLTSIENTTISKLLRKTICLTTQRKAVWIVISQIMESLVFQIVLSCCTIHTLRTPDIHCFTIKVIETPPPSSSLLHSISQIFMFIFMLHKISHRYSYYYRCSSSTGWSKRTNNS